MKIDPSQLAKELPTHLLLQSALVKSNQMRSFTVNRFCKLTSTEILVFNSSTSASLQPHKPLCRIPIPSIKSVEMISNDQIKIQSGTKVVVFDATLKSNQNVEITPTKLNLIRPNSS